MYSLRVRKILIGAQVRIGSELFKSVFLEDGFEKSILNLFYGLPTPKLNSIEAKYVGIKTYSPTLLSWSSIILLSRHCYSLGVTEALRLLQFHFIEIVLQFQSWYQMINYCEIKLKFCTESGCGRRLLSLSLAPAFPVRLHCSRLLLNCYHFKTITYTYSQLPR